MAASEPDVSPFSGLVGIEYISTEPDEARAKVEAFIGNIYQPHIWINGTETIIACLSLCTVTNRIEQGRFSNVWKSNYTRL